jgi:hypothetical protein
MVRTPVQPPIKGPVLSPIASDGGITIPNVAPSGLALSNDTIDENTTGLLGTLSVVLGTPAPTYSITGGADQANFSITGGNQLNVDVAFDYETQTTAVVQVTATNSEGTDVVNFTININDVAEGIPPSGTAISTTAFDENYTGIVGTLSVTAGSPAPTYAIIGGADQANFSILNGNEVHVTIAFDYETQTTAALTVTATNTEGSDILPITFTINDVEEGVVTDGLVSYYKFDGDATDSIGTNDGSSVGDPTYSTGILNNAVVLDGNDYISVPANADQALSTYSISMWVYFETSIPTGWVALLEHDRFGPNNYALFKTSGSNNIRFSYSQSQFVDGNDGVLTPDTWHHIVGTFSGSQANLYIDNVLDNSATNSPSVTPTQDILTIGANNNGSEYFTGSIDEVRIYNRALTPAEITTLFNQGAPLVIPSGLALSNNSIDENTTGLVGTLSVTAGNPTPTYSITGGTDQADFSIQNTNELHLDNSKTFPDTLVVEVTATNSEGTDVETFNITIAEVVAAQSTLDSLIGLSDIDLGYSMARATDGSGGVYSDASVTNYITSGEVQSIKGFGSNPISAPNLAIEARDERSFIDVWFNEEYANVVDNGNLDRYMRFHNNKMRYHSSPSTYTDPIDIVGVCRVMPGPNFETTGIWKFINIDNSWQIQLFSNSFGFSPTFSTNLPDIMYRFHYRITIADNGDWEVRFNDLQKVTPDASGTGYGFSASQHWFGANGHPAPVHEWFRAFNFQTGGFTGTALTNIESYFDALWPEGYDDLPHLRDAYIVSYDSGTNVLSTAAGTFGGGNGIEGTHLYQWYFGYEAFFGNKLDWYYPINGETSATLDRDDITDLYAWLGLNKGASMWFMRTCTPRDSANTEGETFMTQMFNQNSDSESVTPNTINSASVTSITATTATGNVTTPRTGTGYAVVTTSATAPNARGIANGYNATYGRNAAVWSDSQVFGTTGAKTYSITGLSSGTNYWLHQFVMDDNGQPSAVLTTSFTTSYCSTYKSKVPIFDIIETSYPFWLKK